MVDMLKARMAAVSSDEDNPDSPATAADSPAPATDTPAPATDNPVPIADNPSTADNSPVPSNNTPVDSVPPPAADTAKNASADAVEDDSIAEDTIIDDTLDFLSAGANDVPISSSTEESSSKRSNSQSDLPSPKKLKSTDTHRPPPVQEVHVEFDPKDNGLDDGFRLSRFSEMRARRCKVTTASIDNMLKGFQNENTDPAKSTKMGLSMDATILEARHAGLTILQGQEIMYPSIDDPYLLGKVSCTAILSNMYALGVTEVDNMLMKLSVANKMTDKERDVVVPLIIKGFRDAARRGGTQVTGGETVTNPWCMIGGVATAVTLPTEYIIPDQCSAGDVLVLTKPLGTQIAVNCYHWLQSPSAWSKIKLVISHAEVTKAYNRAMDMMQKLNLGAARLMHKYKAHAATAIGGFGLLGHAMALARCQKNEVSFVIHNLPVIAKMAAVAKAKGNMFQLTQGLACEMSGGLLICLPREQAASFCKDIEALEGNQAWIIGIVEKGDRSARIIDKPRVIEVPSKDREGELW